jgi:glucose-6-phosphate 1-dehydrogenase
LKKDVTIVVLGASGDLAKKKTVRNLGDNTADTLSSQRSSDWYGFFMVGVDG